MIFRPLQDRISAFHAISKEDKSFLWYQRLAHINCKYIAETAKKGAVTGLTEVDYKQMPICEDCQIGKQTRKPFPRITVTSNYKPGEKLYADLEGPCRTEAFEATATKCIFVGYTSMDGKYRFYDPNTNNIFEARNATFQEIESLPITTVRQAAEAAIEVEISSQPSTPGTSHAQLINTPVVPDESDLSDSEGQANPMVDEQAYSMFENSSTSPEPLDEENQTVNPPDDTDELQKDQQSSSKMRDII
ncbi:unnamed protein product, partial [Allacma fusca]